MQCVQSLYGDGTSVEAMQDDNISSPKFINSPAMARKVHKVVLGDLDAENGILDYNPGHNCTQNTNDDSLHLR